MRLSYLGKLPLFFTLGIDMRQFLLGTVQLGFDNYSSVWTVCQFLLGTVQRGAAEVIIYWVSYCVNSS